jgi:uncharacterized protein (TIGR03437 family)
VRTPGLFTPRGSGSGQEAFVNQTGTVNGANAPAVKGSSVLVFATGEGQTNLAGVDGQVIPSDANGAEEPLAAVPVTIGGVTAVVQYAGCWPGQVFWLVNVVVPDGARNSSPSAATIAIQ